MPSRDRPRSLCARWLYAIALGAGIASGARAESLEIADAWMREPPPGRNVAALYLRVHNAGPIVVHVKGVRVPAAESASIHESVESDGMVRMRAVPDLEVPPRATVSLEPGGFHVMVFGLARAWRGGERVPFCLLLQEGGEACSEAAVKGLEEQADG